MSPPSGPPVEDHPMAGQVPIHWEWNRGRPVVDWCGLGGLRLTAPFFAQTVQDAQKLAGAVRRTPADVLAAWPETGPGARPAGLIFHLSRCGSTLAAQALAAAPENIVASEPQAVDEVLWAGRIFLDLPPGMAAAALRGLARAYGWRRFPEETRFFLKFDAWHILDFRRIKEAFPDSPWIFLYRDPVEVLVSQLTEVSGRMLPGPMTAGYLELPLLELLQLPQEELCARALGRIAEAGWAAAREDADLGRVVNYAELPGALETLVAPWFGLPWQSADQARLRRTAGFHSKSPERPFAADGPAKQRLATEELRSLASRWVGPVYDRLEALRAARPLA